MVRKVVQVAPTTTDARLNDHFPYSRARAAHSLAAAVSVAAWDSLVKAGSDSVFGASVEAVVQLMRRRREREGSGKRAEEGGRASERRQVEVERMEGRACRLARSLVAAGCSHSAVAFAEAAVAERHWREGRAEGASAVEQQGSEVEGVEGKSEERGYEEALSAKEECEAAAREEEEGKSAIAAAVRRRPAVEVHATSGAA